MPGMIFMFEAMVKGKLQACFMCDKCRKIFAFMNKEKLACPRCGGRAYPMNLDPVKGESRLITP